MAWTVERITELCVEYCGRCNIKFNSPIIINGRLTRTLGRCFYERINEQDEMKEVPQELCEIYRETLAESLIFSHKVQKEMKENQMKMKEAIVRYDASNMMKEYLG